MTAVTITTTPTVIVPPGTYNSISVLAYGTGDIYLSWDGTMVSVANGFPLLGSLSYTPELRLTGNDQCKKGLSAVIAAGTKDVYVNIT